MLHLLQMAPFKVLTSILFLDSKLQAVLTPEAALPAASLILLKIPTATNTATSSSDSHTSTVLPGTSSANAALPLHPRL